MTRALLSLLVALASADCAFAQPSEIILIRHGEKPDDDHPDLSLRGRERAAALAPYFLGAPELLDYKTPVAIFAQAQKKATSSIRAMQTVQPLADALKITVDQTHNRDEFRPMVAAILADGKLQGHSVLICWEHKVLVDIARQFGVDNPPQWHGSDYDHTWIIALKPDEKPTLKILPQHLLYGDSEK